MDRIYTLLRYTLPFTVMHALSNHLPDLPAVMRFRGILLRPFFKKCGAGLVIGRNTHILYPSNIKLGENVYIGYGTCIMAVAPIQIESQVYLGVGTVIVPGNHGKKGNSYRFGQRERAPITIKKNAHIGPGAVLLKGVTIGENAEVAANTPVARDVENNGHIFAAPARLIEKEA
ncbi:MAG TPA: acyltransferase [Saprospiraceae bacterium]|nr:acyltransferase [Saprospiraceae bacterium]HMQ83908.1 acyltransferase [Saprospiraceae bacterium]